MALDLCRECDGQVSTEADSCPHCGCPEPILDEEARHDRRLESYDLGSSDGEERSSRDLFEKISLKRTMVFENPVNGHREQESKVGIAVSALCFGPIYFIYRGHWAHAFLDLVMIPLTLGVGHLAYAFKAPDIIRREYLQEGWHEVT